MNKIENISQLKFEIDRLKRNAKDQELTLRNDLSALKEDIKPVNLILNGVSSLTGININKNDFFKDGIAYGLSLLFQRFVLKSEKKFEGKIYSFVDSIFERANSFMHKHTNSEAKRKDREDG